MRLLVCGAHSPRCHLDKIDSRCFPPIIIIPCLYCRARVNRAHSHKNFTYEKVQMDNNKDLVITCRWCYMVQSFRLCVRKWNNI